MTRAKSSASYEIDAIDIETRKTVHITHDTPREWSNGHPIWSPDGKRLAWTRRHANGKNSDVLVAEVASGRVLNLTAHDGDMTYSVASWSPDGKKLLVTSNAANGYENVALLGLDGQLRWLASETHEMQAGDYSPDGAKVTWTANMDGTRQSIFVMSPADPQKPRRCRFRQGSTRWRARRPPSAAMDGICSFITAAPTLPAICLILISPRGSARQITNSLVAGLHGEDMVKPSLVRYPSRDGKWQISALVYIPHSIMQKRRTIRRSSGFTAGPRRKP